MSSLFLFNSGGCQICHSEEIDENNLCANCVSLIAPIYEEYPLNQDVLKKVYLSCGYNEMTQELIHRFKFNHERWIEDVFSYYLAQTILKYKLHREYLITYVPMDRRSYLKRGYNQSQTLASATAEHLGMEVCDLLRKVGKHRPQVGLNLRERKLNVKDSFTAREDLEDKKIIVIDDVLTTGATLDDCARALYETGAAEVVGLTIVKAHHLDIKNNRV